MKKYYLHNGVGQEGPFDLSELKEKYIKSDTPIWYNGIAEWTTAGKVEELISLLNPVVPPPFQQSPPPQAQNMTKISEPLKQDSSKEKRKNKTGLIIGVIAIVLAGILFVMLKNNPNSIPDVKVVVNPPKPVVLNPRSEDASAVFKAKLKVLATIQNQGGDGNVFITFTVVQNGNAFNKSQSFHMSAGESKEVDEMFREIKRGDGDVTYQVDARAE
jgi:hypothetical protein